jgi:hypothetical protein
MFSSLLVSSMDPSHLYHLFASTFHHDQAVRQTAEIQLNAVSSDLNRNDLAD